jgi:hypothetical protein
MSTLQEPRTNAPQGPLFLVIGTAINETVIHQETGRARHGLGGVAATMAMALAEAGNHVTLITAVGAGQHGEEARRLLGDAPYRAVVLDRKYAAGYARIPTMQGEQKRAEGRWPRISGLEETVLREAPGCAAVLMDCNLNEDEMNPILSANPETLTLVNGTTTRRCLTLSRTTHIWKSAVTLNRQEARNLMQGPVPAGSEQELPRRLNAECVLVTRGAGGWDLHGWPDREAVSTRPAVPAPERTDFIGCGDHAAAGLAHALVHGQGIAQTVNEFITRKLQSNVL